MDVQAQDPVAVVQRQLDAYNAHDLGAFVACFDEDVRAYRMPVQSPSLSGRAQLAAFYAEHRFRIPGLRAELLGRTVLGGKVIDHERIHGLAEAPSELIAIYQVSDGLIDTVWFFYP